MILQKLKKDAEGYLGEKVTCLLYTSDNRIDMIFHMNQNPYEAEQNDIVLSNTCLLYTSSGAPTGAANNTNSAIHTTCFPEPFCSALVCPSVS